MNGLRFWIAVGLLASSTGEAADGASAVQRGRDLFMGYAEWSNGTQATRNGLPHPFNACAHCHGPTGEGLREGDTFAPALTWEALTTRVSAAPAYTNSSALFTAVTQGHGRGGMLSPVMPRFQLTKQDWRDLLAYLRILGSAKDLPTGVSTNAVRIATRLPFDAAGKALLNGLRTVVEASNGRGGIHGRHLELLVLPAGTSLPEIARIHPFLLVGGTSVADDQWLGSQRISHLAALTGSVGAASADAVWTAPLFAGPAEQKAFLDTAARQGADGWQLMGGAAGRILVEALAQAGPRLHERAVLNVLPELNGLEILPGWPLAFRAGRLFALDSGAALTDRSPGPTATAPLKLTAEESP